MTKDELFKGLCKNMKLRSRHNKFKTTQNELFKGLCRKMRHRFGHENFRVLGALMGQQEL